MITVNQLAIYIPYNYFLTSTIYDPFRFQYHSIPDTLYIQDIEIVTRRFAKGTYCHPAALATVELIL